MQCCWCPQRATFINGPPNSIPRSRLTLRCQSSQDPNRASVQEVLLKLQGGGRRRRQLPDSIAQEPPEPNHATGEVQPRTESSEPNPFDADAPPRTLSERQLLTFERKGHLCTRGLLQPQEVARLHAEVSRHAEERCMTALQHRMRVLLRPEQQVPVTSREQGLQHLQRHSRELGFLQHFNLHRHAGPVSLLQIRSPSEPVS